MAKSKIMQILKIELEPFNGDPPKINVNVLGQVPTGGWSMPELLSRDNTEPPQDGIQEFDFVAEPPAGNSTQSSQGILPIVAIYVFNSPPSWLRGIRVYASTNNMETLIGDQLTSQEKEPSIESQDWNAWINVMPGKQTKIFVTGIVFGSNSGVEAQLNIKEPQGADPTTLLLDLKITQKPGNSTKQVVRLDVRYEKVLELGFPKYKQVEIFSENVSIVTIPVREVH